MSTVVTTLQKGLAPFSPLRTQQLPGGSLILDQNLDRIKQHLDQLTPLVSIISRTLNVNVGPGGGTSGRVINTTAPLAGGGPLTSDLTLSLGIDGTLVVTGGGLLGREAISGDVVIPAGSNTATIQPHVVSYAKIQQQTASTLLGNPTGSLADTQAFGLGAGLGFVSVGPGVFVLKNTSPLSDLSANVPLSLAGTTLSAPGVLYTNGGPSPVNLGGLASGVLQQAVSVGVSTPSIFSAGATRIAFGSGSNGQLTDTANFAFSGGKFSLGQATFDGTQHVVLTDDAAPGTIAAWDSRHATFGVATSTGAGFGISHSTGTSSTNLSAVLPNAAWENLRVQALTVGLYSSGSILGLFQDSGGNVYDSLLTSNGLLKTSGGNGKHAIAAAGTDYQAPVTWPAASQVLVSAGVAVDPQGDSTFTFDRVAHTLSAGAAISINGAGIASNVSLVLGTTTTPNRDRALFFVGGGALGATGTSDNTLFDIVPGNTTIRGGVTAGIYATQRIRAISYTGPGTTLTEAATLYIDGAPSLGGGISSTTRALHVASGQTLLGGNLTSSLLVAGGITAVDTTGTFGIAGVGGLPAAVAGEQHYYVNVTGSTLVTGGAVWLGTSSTAGQGGVALEYVHHFTVTTIALDIRLITNAITAGTLAVQITRNGASFATITLNNASSGTLTTGTLTVGSPLLSDRWGVLVTGTGTTMAGNMVFTGTLLLAPNVF